MATIADFSVLLAGSDRGERDRVYAALRRIYDGQYKRDIGGMPEPLIWRGRLTLLAAVTPAIDAYSSHSDALGPRWVYCRIPDLSKDGQRKATALARQHATDKAKLRRKLREAANEAIRNARLRLPNATLTDAFADAIRDAAIMVAIGRAAVPRSGYGAREIMGEITREEPMRLAGQLTLLARGLLALGVPEADAIAIVTRCALDCLPITRRRVIDRLLDADSATAASIAREIGCARRLPGSRWKSLPSSAWRRSTAPIATRTTTRTLGARARRNIGASTERTPRLSGRS